MGHNQWLKVANHGTVSSDPQFLAINNTLYWALLQAVQFGEAQNKVKMHETTAIREPNGNGAWQELVKWFETSHSNELMTVSVEKAIDSLNYRDSGEQTIGGFIDEFNNLIYEHGKYCGTEPHTESRKLRKFKDSMEGTSKFSTIMDLATVNQ